MLAWLTEVLTARRKLARLRGELEAAEKASRAHEAEATRARVALVTEGIARAAAEARAEDLRRRLAALEARHDGELREIHGTLRDLRDSYADAIELLRGWKDPAEGVRRGV